MGLSEDADSYSGARPYPFAETEPDVGDSDRLLLARAYFDGQEYRRAAFAVDATFGSSLAAGDVTCDASTPNLQGLVSPKALFFGCYALYLAGEKRKEEALATLADEEDSGGVVNEYLRPLQSQLTTLHAQDRLDAFGLYMFGVVLKELGLVEEARRVLCQSVDAYPLNWSAWLDLAALCTSQDDLVALPLHVDHWARKFFEAHTLLELQANKPALQVLEALSQRAFASSPYLKGRRATALYALSEYPAAREAFEEIRKEDPFTLDGMEHLSNILFVLNERVELSFLAHHAFQLDKFRPETCSIVGNYHALRCEHDVAVTYFRRAIRMNRKHLSAWVLLGHEFLELKNAGAAIEAYRHAVDINPLDFRAWYGLGQVYEMLRMPFYALHYYRKTTVLRPYDARMWRAMADCYTALERSDDAIKCLERAVCHVDSEVGSCFLKLGQLHCALRNDLDAARYFSKYVNTCSDFKEGSQDLAQAMLFLATYARDNRRLEDASRYAVAVAGMPWPEASEAKSLLREIGAMIAR